MNEKLAALIGMLLSDGSVYFDKSKRTYCIQLTSKPASMRRVFESLMRDCFGIKNFHENDCKNAISSRAFSKSVAQQLFAYTPTYRTQKFPDGSFPPARIPKEILASEKLIRAFLRTYASCDGCAYRNSSHPNGVVEIACTHPTIRSQLAECLGKLGIHCRTRYKGVEIYRSESVRKFRDVIGFLDESLVSDTTSSRFGTPKNELLSPCLP